MDDIFDDTGDDLTIARRDLHLVETSRFNDGFRDGLESSEQDGFDSGFVRGYSLIASLVYDFYFEKETVRLHDPTSSLLTKEFQDFETELDFTVAQLKRPDEINEQQQVETLRRLRTQFDQLQLKLKLETLSIKSA